MNIIYMHKTNGRVHVTSEGEFERGFLKMIGDKVNDYIRFEHAGPIHRAYVAVEFTYWMEGERFFIATPVRSGVSI